MIKYEIFEAMFSERFEYLQELKNTMSVLETRIKELEDELDGMINKMTDNSPI